MVHLSSLVRVVVGLLLTSPSLISATPLPSDNSETPKARVVPISDRRAVARQAGAYDPEQHAKREVQRMRRRVQRFSEMMERSGVQLDGLVERRDSTAAPAPYDIGGIRRAAMAKRQGSAADPLNNYKDTSE